MRGVTSPLTFLLPRHNSTKFALVIACVVFISILILTNDNSTNNESRARAGKWLSGLLLAYWYQIREGIVNIDLDFTRVDRKHSSYRSNRILKTARNLSLSAFHNDFIIDTSRPRGTKSTSGVISASPRYFPEQQETCAFPKLDASDEFMMSKVRRTKRPSCDFGHPNWVRLVNGSVVFSRDVIRLVGNFTCDSTPVLGVGDTGLVQWGKMIENIADGFRFPSDVFRLDCRAGQDADGQRARRFSHIFHGVAHRDWSEWFGSSSQAQPEKDSVSLTSSSMPKYLDLDLRSKDTPSVLILGFGSMSRMSWIRRMPRTRQFFLDQLGAIEMKGYNSVGPGTWATFLAILAGMDESQVSTDHNELTLDALPWLWREFSRNGYVTSLAVSDADDDVTTVWGGSCRRANYFRQQPTHYFSRPFYAALKSLNRSSDSSNSYCLGDVPKHVDWLRWSRDVFHTHRKRPKFMFHFYNSLSLYDNDDIWLADDDLVSFLADLRVKGHLKDTAVLLVSDHGSRSSDVTSAWPGKMEERLPYLAISLPVMFKQQHTDSVHNLQRNALRLTTPFDLYQTLKFIISSSNKNNTNSSSNNRRNTNKNSRSNNTTNNSSNKNNTNSSSNNRRNNNNNSRSNKNNNNKNNNNNNTIINSSSSNNNNNNINCCSNRGSRSWDSDIRDRKRTPSKGMNLFEEIPISRSCYDARINNDWCACLQHVTMETNHTKVVEAAEEVVDHLNRLTLRDRRVCSFLTLARIQSAGRWSSTSNDDIGNDNNRPRFKSRSRSKSWRVKGGKNKEISREEKTFPLQEDYYHVTFYTQQGQGRFKATVTHRIGEDSMYVKTDDVTSLDTQVDSTCRHNVSRILRQFCVCKEEA